MESLIFNVLTIENGCFKRLVVYPEHIGGSENKYVRWSVSTSRGSGLQWVPDFKEAVPRWALSSEGSHILQRGIGMLRRYIIGPQEGHKDEIYHED